MKQWIFSGGCLGVLFLAAPLLRAQDPDELLAVRFPARHGYITWAESLLRKMPQGILRKHPRMEKSRFVFPSPAGNRELHMLDKCKAVAEAAELDREAFSLKKFRSTYATRMLRAGFDVRTVQHWMGHKSLETTMRYLAPAKDVRDKLDRVEIAGFLNG
jgi:integrase